MKHNDFVSIGVFHRSEEFVCVNWRLNRFRANFLELAVCADRSGAYAENPANRIPKRDFGRTGFRSAAVRTVEL
jgi:hypothetical protein